MKKKDFIRLDQALEAIEMAYETCDTSLTDEEYEYYSEIRIWNEEFNSLVETAKSLREQIIFVFKLEDKGEE